MEGLGVTRGAAVEPCLMASEPVSLVPNSKSSPSGWPTSTWSLGSKVSVAGWPPLPPEGLHLRTSTLPSSPVPSGTLVCGKCALKTTPKCINVLQVKEGDKTVNYFLDDKGNGESYHEGVCGGDKVEGVTVTGTVTEKDGKKYIKPSKVETKK